MQWNRPSRSDRYAMVVACQVARVLSSKPGEIRPEMFRLREDWYALKEADAAVQDEAERGGASDDPAEPQEPDPSDRPPRPLTADEAARWRVELAKQSQLAAVRGVRPAPERIGRG